MKVKAAISVMAFKGYTEDNNTPNDEYARVVQIDAHRLEVEKLKALLDEGLERRAGVYCSDFTHVVLTISYRDPINKTNRILYLGARYNGPGKYLTLDTEFHKHAGVMLNKSLMANKVYGVHPEYWKAMGDLFKPKETEGSELYELFNIGE